MFILRPPEGIDLIYEGITTLGVEPNFQNGRNEGIDLIYEGITTVQNFICWPKSTQQKELT